MYHAKREGPGNKKSVDPKTKDGKVFYISFYSFDCKNEKVVYVSNGKCNERYKRKQQ